MRGRCGTHILRAALPLGLALLLGAGRASGDVNVAVTPATLTVDGGSTFILDLTVSPAGSAFNGFDITVSFDPAALTLQPMSPLADQEGCLMTGDCSASPTSSPTEPRASWLRAVFRRAWSSATWAWAWERVWL